MVKRFKVPSTTDARRRYVVVIRGRKWSCSCKAWIFRRGHLRHKLIRRQITKKQFNHLVRTFRCRHIKSVAR